MAMVESISTTSLLGRRPLCGRISAKDIVSCKQKSSSNWFAGKRIVVSPLSRSRVERLIANSSITVLAMELTKEVRAYRDEGRTSRNWNYRFGTSSVERERDLWPPENRADNPLLHNPLLRQERMGCGWLGALFEWEGVLIEDNHQLDKQAWLALAEEEGRSPPPAFILRRIEGMKNEQAISEVLCWSRDPGQFRRMAARKEEIYQALQGGMYSLRNGSEEFVSALTRYNIPMALVSTRPRKVLETAIRAIGMEGLFSVIVAAEDVHRGKPDPEMFVYAAQLLQFIPERSIVFGNSNPTVEAAHDARMKCVAVASKHPVYELGAADLVVNRLDELSIVDMKKLAAVESDEFGSEEPELEMEMEEEESRRSGSIAVDDIFR